MGTLVLMRHGQSEWNLKNQFTGFTDVELTKQGIEEAIRGGQEIGEKGIRFDHVFTSTLKRAYQTGELALKNSGINDHLQNSDGTWQMTKHDDLRERDYGDLVGLNKAETAKKFGDEQVHIWRRSYDVPPPGGESLKDVVNRVTPYFEQNIQPLLDAGKNVFVAAHGNSLRATVITLGHRTPDNINEFEIPTGQPLYFDWDNT